MSDEQMQNAEQTQFKTVTLLEADLPRLILSGFLSKRTQFTLRIDGPVDDKSFDALMKLLAVQQEILRESGEPA